MGAVVVGVFAVLVAGVTDFVEAILVLLVTTGFDAGAAVVGLVGFDVVFDTL